MSRSRTTLLRTLLVVLLAALAALLARAHLRAWDLGGRSPVLSYDSAQYALAARELADHHLLATDFALPVELVRHGAPPWPLAVVQPGLVVAEAALFALRGQPPATSAADPRAWLVLVLPLLAFAATAIAIALAVARLLERHGGLSAAACVLAGGIAGAAFLLDPEAQHFATGGFTEIPFTLGLVLAVATLALGGAARRPLLFGLLLGATGAFRANMLWLAPVFAVGAALVAPERRARVLVMAIAGYALLSLPWWFYKWSAFGSPGWDLSRWVVWEGVEGRSWYSIYHLPRDPDVPHGAAALRLLLQKLGHTLPTLLLAVGTGPRALWLGALAIWGLLPGPRASRVAAWVTLAAFAAGLLTAAISIPWLRYVFPARVALEAAGLTALWGVLGHFLGARAGATRLLALAAAALAIAWGAWGTARGIEEATVTSAARDVPAAASLDTLAAQVRRELPPGEPVMSNLGPILAWGADRQVVHLALAPGDLDACRRLLDVRHVLLVFRNAERAGTGWADIVERPAEAPKHAEWGIASARAWMLPDGFRAVWLELQPLRPQVAWRDGGAERRYCGITRRSPGRSSPSSVAGYSAGSSRRLSTKSGTSAASSASASGPAPTRITS